MSTEDTTIIRELRKNATEKLQVNLSRYRDHDLLGLRVFYDKGGNDWHPGKQGVALRVAMLPDLLEALADAAAEARRRGLLPEVRR